MPIYEYQAVDKGCSHCERRFDVLQPMGAKPLETCPECGSPVRKVISKVSIVKDALSNSRLKEQGFTKLVKRDKGVYEKVN